MPCQKCTPPPPCQFLCEGRVAAEENLEYYNCKTWKKSTLRSEDVSKAKVAPEWAWQPVWPQSKHDSFTVMATTMQPVPSHFLRSLSDNHNIYVTQTDRCLPSLHIRFCGWGYLSNSNGFCVLHSTEWLHITYKEHKYTSFSTMQFSFLHTSQSHPVLFVINHATLLAVGNTQRRDRTSLQIYIEKLTCENNRAGRYFDLLCPWPVA